MIQIKPFRRRAGASGNSGAAFFAIRGQKGNESNPHGAQNAPASSNPTAKAQAAGMGEGGAREDLQKGAIEAGTAPAELAGTDRQPTTQAEVSGNSFAEAGIVGKIKDLAAAGWAAIRRVLG